MSTSQQLAKLLSDYKAVRYGEFITKSGMPTSYFVNFGILSTGNALIQLGNIIIYIRKFRPAGNMALWSSL